MNKGTGMKLVKKINNNFALATDGTGEQVIVEGKGIGFQKMPMELADMSMISRTYYDVDEKYIALIASISPEAMETASRTIAAAKRSLHLQLNPNAAFTLADHLQFVLDRMDKGIPFDFPFSKDMELTYKKEMDLSRACLRDLSKRTRRRIPIKEATGVALNLINAEMKSPDMDKETEYSLMEKTIMRIVENFFDVRIDEGSVVCARFYTHLRYLFDRLGAGQTIDSTNLHMFESMQKEAPEAAACTELIGNYLFRKKNWNLDEEEQLYLILHINRLMTKTRTVSESA